MTRRAFALLAVFIAVCAAPALAAEKLPPAPDRYFNDYAHIASQGTAEALNAKLEAFEQQTSSQVVVAIYPKFDSESDLNDYCTRVFRAWGIGQKGKDNGVGLFIFVQDHKLYIVTGYGMEGPLPDALCHRIIDTEIKPAFKQGDYDRGLTAGVNAILLATQGEYKGTGSTVAEQRHTGGGSSESGLIRFLFSPWGFFLIFVVLNLIFARRSGTVYGRSGMSNAGWFLAGLGSGGGGGGGWSGGGGGGFSGGGGGGFSGGGGSSGGGGAGGSW